MTAGGNSRNVNELIENIEFPKSLAYAIFNDSGNSNEPSAVKIPVLIPSGVVPTKKEDHGEKFNTH